MKEQQVTTLAKTASNQLDTESLVALIQPHGAISNLFKGFEPRQQQVEMMQNIIEAYNHNQITLIEAGTGTGKSMAYLIPALIAAAKLKERTIISTNTINLQEQLINKDIPFLLKALNIDVKVALMKGSNNYLCIRKLEDATAELKLFPSDTDKEIENIAAAHYGKNIGTKSDLPFLPSMNAWDRVKTETEACLFQECPHYQQCHYFKAKRHADNANIIIANHSLLFSDLVARSEDDNYSDPMILPSYSRIILDEAHHIEDVATNFFAMRFNRMELMKLLNRLSLEKGQQQIGKLPQLSAVLQHHFKGNASHEVKGILSRLEIELPAHRMMLNFVINDVYDAITDFVEFLQKPVGYLKNDEIIEPTEKKLRILPEHQSLDKWCHEVYPKTQILITSLKQYQQMIVSIDEDLKTLKNEKVNDLTKNLRLDIRGLILKLSDVTKLFEHFISEYKDRDRVRWIESNQLKMMKNIELVEASLDVSKLLANNLFAPFSSVILCSATLSANKSFEFLKSRYGLTKHHLPERVVKEHIYDSPFNFAKQSLLLIPTDIPAPSHPQFSKIAFEHIWKAIEVSRGGTFVLFTSYGMMQECAQVLRQRLEEHKYLLLMQGDNHRKIIVDQFRNQARAVLFGTDSFWEGVDISGDALRCVVIVKLPFRVPSEPIVQARTEQIIHRGGNPFLEYMVPHAVVKFKQGFGRLIRHKCDRGCVVCLDNRLIQKNYGKMFLNSLPPSEDYLAEGALLWTRMDEFYRKTYYLVKQSQGT